MKTLTLSYIYDYIYIGRDTNQKIQTASHQRLYKVPPGEGFECSLKDLVMAPSIFFSNLQLGKCNLGLFATWVFSKAT